MSVVSGPPRAVYAAAVETLAGRVLRALTGAEDAFRLAAQLPAGNSTAGLAAVRVLGPDVLTPFTLAGHQFDPEDAEVVASSIRTFPTSEPDDGSDARPLRVRHLRDWATGQVLTQLGVPDFARTFPGWTGPGTGGDVEWRSWAAALAQLSPLASPGLDSALHADARRYRLGTARGVTRALLRRDHLTAARLARWLAAGGTAPVDPPFPLEPVLRHLELLADGDPQVLLEIAVARRGWGVGGDD